MEFASDSKDEVLLRDEYCNHIHKGDKYSRVPGNVNFEAHVKLNSDDCVDVSGDRHPHTSKKMSDRASLLQAKKDAARAAFRAKEEAKISKPVVPTSELALARVETRTKSGLKQEQESAINFSNPSRIEKSERKSFNIIKGATDRCDIAWGVARILRREGGVDVLPTGNKLKTGFTGIDNIDLQIELEEFFRPEGSNGSDFTLLEHVPKDHTIIIPKTNTKSSCILFEAPQKEFDEAEAPATGLKPHQLTCWHLFRAWSVAMHPNYEEFETAWKIKNETEANFSNNDVPKAYDGFDVNQAYFELEDGKTTRVNHNPLMTPKGMLVYHSTGSGKTNVAVCALQAFWFQTDRPIIYVSTTTAVNSVIGKKANKDEGCENVALRSEYTRLAQLFFPTTLGDDNAAFDANLLRNSNINNAKCVQSYLGSPHAATSRLKAITFIQLAEFILKCREDPTRLFPQPGKTAKDTNQFTDTPTIVAGDKVYPIFSSTTPSNVFNAIIIVDEAHNLLRKNSTPWENLKDDQGSSEKESAACQIIHDYLESELSDKNTVIFLTATPAENLKEDVDSLQRLLRRPKQEVAVNLVSYFSAEKNFLEFPVVTKAESEGVDMTLEQTIRIPKHSDPLKLSTLPESAEDILPKLTKIIGGSDEVDFATQFDHTVNAAYKRIFEQENAYQQQDTAGKGTQFKPYEPPQKTRDEYKVEYFKKGGEFSKRAPKLARVANEAVSGDLKTFVYSAFPEATLGISMLLEHSHDWRLVDTATIKAFKEKFSLGTSNVESKLSLVDEIFAEKQIGNAKEKISQLLQNAKDLMKEILDQTTKDLAIKEFPTEEHLNRDIPRSLKGLQEQIVDAETKLETLYKDKVNHSLELSMTFSVVSLLIGVLQSLENMKKVLANLGSSNISEVVHMILENNGKKENELSKFLVMGERAGVAKKRFAVINKYNAHDVLAVFNHFLNRDGDILMAVVSDSETREGLNLKTTRRILACEPLESVAKMQQLIGRARRFCSHAELPADKQTVLFKIYYSRANPSIEDQVEAMQQKYNTAHEQYLAKREEILSSFNKGIRDRDEELLGIISSERTKFYASVDHSYKSLLELKQLQQRLNEARSTGSELNSITAQFVQRVESQNVIFRTSLILIKESTDAVVAAVAEHHEFEKEFFASKLNLLAEVDHARTLRNKEREQYEITFGVPIDQEVHFVTRSAEEVHMINVQILEEALEQRLAELQESAADALIIQEVMKSFSKQS